jgi:hypothetical protein
VWVIGSIAYGTVAFLVARRGGVGDFTPVTAAAEAPVPARAR